MANPYIDAHYLDLHIDNDRDLCALKLRIFANYAKKRDAGKFLRLRAHEGLMRSLVNIGAAHCRKQDWASCVPAWHIACPISVRRRVADGFLLEFDDWYAVDYGGQS